MSERDPRTLSSPPREARGQVGVQAPSPAPDAEREARETAEEAKRMGREVAGDLKARGREAVEGAKEEASERIDRGTSQAAGRLEPVVRALKTAARELEGEGEATLAGYTRQAASRVDRMTGYLRDEDARSMMADLEEMARNHPGTFVGTSFAAGLALGRFLRASAPDHPPERASASDRPSERASPDRSPERASAGGPVTGPAGEKGGFHHG